VPQKYVNRISPAVTSQDRRKMAAMVLAMDDAVGVVLQALRETGLEENTLVFFLNDNGGVFIRKDKPAVSYNTPFKGGKYVLNEGGIRVPFVLQWKARLPAGSTYDQPVSSLDILPTAVAAAGGAVDPAWQIDGMDLLPFIEGRDNSVPHPLLCWRVNDRTAVRKGGWKLHQNNAGQPMELFNLAEDAGEQNDLAAQYPDKVAELQAEWKRWNARMAPPRQWAKDAKGKSKEE
jgi:arylsulfatase A-like enzyme